MRILVCGDRNWSGRYIIYRELKDFPKDTVVIHGAARGADTLGGIVAEELGFKVEVYPADWEKYGKAAGPIRNREMLEAGPDLVLAFHNNIEKSKGTKDMVEISKRANIETKIITGPVVYTSTVNYKGPNRLNISVKSGDKTFAPTWDMVQKMRKGEIKETEFREKYYSLMRASYKKEAEKWLSLLNKKEIVLVCHCRPCNFCHRYLLAEILVKLGANYRGEI